jgi:hypothetical protein
MRYKRVIGIEYNAEVLRVGEIGFPAYEELLLPADSTEAGKMIVRFVDKAGLAGIPAVLGVPAEVVYLSFLKTSSNSRSERKTVIRKHVDSLRSLSGSETISDIVSIKARGKQKSVLLGVARLDSITSLINPLQSAGINIEAAVSSSLALFNLITQKSSRTNKRVVVLCPASDSSVEVLCGIGDTLFGVWRILIDTSSVTGRNSSMRTFAAELEATWRSNSVGHTELPSVIWCGDTQLNEEVSKLLEDTIGSVPIHISDWFSNHKLPDKNKSLLPFALSQCLNGRTNTQLNLLPSPYREQNLKKMLLPYHALAAVLFAVLAFTLSLYEYRRTSEMKQRLHKTEARIQERQVLQQQQNFLIQSNEELEKQVAAMRKSAVSSLHIRDLFIAISAAKSPSDLIVCIADAQSYFQMIPEQVHKQKDEKSISPFAFSLPAFIVEGYTPGADLSSVRSFIEKLRMHPQVATVDLLGDDRVNPDRSPEFFRAMPLITRFVMEVRLREPQ